MYESPIQITQVGEQIGTELSEQEDAYVFSVVKRLYVDVDKDELIKALDYDRGQYEIGYRDGRAARDAEIVRCKDCKHLELLNTEWYYARCAWNGRLFTSFGTPDTRCWFCADGERKEDDGEMHQG